MLAVFIYIVQAIATHKAVFSILSAWFVREYPYISTHGGIYGIAKDLLVGIKPKQ